MFEIVHCMIDHPTVPICFDVSRHHNVDKGEGTEVRLVMNMCNYLILGACFVGECIQWQAECLDLTNHLVCFLIPSILICQPIITV